MITSLGKSCLLIYSACPSSKVISLCVCVSFPFGFEGGVLSLIVLIPDHCLSFYFTQREQVLKELQRETGNGNA